MKRIALALALVISAVFISGATAASGIQYRYKVPTNMGHAFAKGAGVPLSKCAFIKQHRIFGCRVSANFNIFLTRPGLHLYRGYRVVNNKITWTKSIQA